MNRMRKFLVALGAAMGVAGAALADGSLSGSEVSQVALAVVGAALVWLVPNDDSPVV